MQDDHMKNWFGSSFFEGGQAYIESLYEAYLEDPQAVPQDWQDVFAQLPATSSTGDVAHSVIREEFKQLAKQPRLKQVNAASAALPSVKQLKVLELIEAYRHDGHQKAQLDPLHLWKRPRLKF